MKKIHLGFFFAIILALISCSNDDDDNNQGTPPPTGSLTIYETAVSSDNLSILTEALERTELDAPLNEPGSYTLFAPTDKAFIDAGLSIDDLSNEELTNLLLNHVLNTEVLSQDLSTGYVTTLAKGPDDTYISMFVNTEEGIEFNGTSIPLADGLDTKATNGVLHLVDTPIGIPDVGSHIVINRDLEALEEVLVDYGEDLIEVIQGDGPFTFFAPSVYAFENISDVLGQTLTDEMIRTILKYHLVVGQNLREEDLTEGLTLTTYGGETLMVHISDGPRLEDALEGIGAGFSETDIQGSNGVIHMINRVLIPASLLDEGNDGNISEDITIATILGIAPFNYTQFLEALNYTELYHLISDPTGNHTLFIPTNDVIEAYLEQYELETLLDLEYNELKSLLLNHFIPGTYNSEAILATGNSYLPTLVSTPSELSFPINLYINTDEGIIINGSSNVTPWDTDIIVNGALHAVDRVIELPTVVTFATADPNLSSLAEALTLVEESAKYIETLTTPWGTTPAPFTVFAPDNEAFNTLLINLDAENLESIAPDVLEGILAYHVVPDVNIHFDFIAPGPLETLGGEVTLSTDGGNTITDPNGGISNITTTNIQAYNGVIHVLDRVLLPDTIN